MTPTVCTAEDDFTRELADDRRQAGWRVELSNGEIVYQDDNRPGCDPASAWIRLGEYVRTHGLSIRKMWLQFRSNKLDNILANDADGYYFCKAALGMFGRTDTLEFYLIGYLQNSTLRVYRWKVPELILIEEERREPEKAGPCLILNPTVQT